MHTGFGKPIISKVIHYEKDEYHVVPRYEGKNILSGNFDIFFRFLIENRKAGVA